ncbi:MAG: 5'/3'-nucleotidase SurE [Sphaerochaetaceae bacterium]|nr:5'/3'-nucleotidase SurE [Sphaerochaetaceae bacterium]
MKILLTNDDGYKAEGINILADELKAYGHEIWVVAPSRERSANSQKITMHREVHFTEIKENWYSCSGTPADCMLFSLKEVLDEKPDLVVSGINHGFNLSTDIIYSGTVGAAKEASIQGIKSIAISAGSGKQKGLFKFKDAARFLADNLELFYGFSDYKSFININYPYNCSGKWETGGVGFIEYFDSIQKIENSVEDGNEKEDFKLNEKCSDYVIVGGNPSLKESESRSDFEITREGNISITPLQVLPGVDNAKLEKLKSYSTIKK